VAVGCAGELVAGAHAVKMIATTTTIASCARDLGTIERTLKVTAKALPGFRTYRKSGRLG